MIRKIWQEGFRIGRNFPNSYDEICKLRKKKRELELSPRKRKRQHNGSLSRLKEREIVERQNKTGGTKDSSTVELMIKHGKFNLNFLAVLALASFTFLIFTFQPFPMGWIAYILAGGITGITIFSIHIALKSFFEKRWLICGISSLCVGFALIAHVYVAIIRGALLKELYGSSQVEFYSSTMNLLSTALPFICLALEIGAGVALFLALGNLFSIEVQDYKNLKDYRAKMVHADAEIEAIKNIPEVEGIDLEEGAMYGAKVALAPKEKKDIEKRLAWIVPAVILLLLFLSLFTAKAFGYETENLTVVEIDLSRSSLNKDNNGHTEFEKNLIAVGDILSEIEPDSRIIVIGITQSSFSNPMIILDREIPREPGFFKENLKSSREGLVTEWNEKSKELRAEYDKTDIFGGMVLAAHLLSGKKSAKLIIFSDLRHYAGDFDLESPSVVNYEDLLNEVEAQGLIPSLQGVEIHCLGVHTSNKSFMYWQSLSKFWEGFFARSQGILREYSILRRLK